MNLLRSVSLLALATASLAASADLRTYGSLGSWQSTVSPAPVFLEDFSSYPNGFSFAGSTYDFNGFSIRSFGGSSIPSDAYIDNGEASLFIDNLEPVAIEFFMAKPSSGFTADVRLSAFATPLELALDNGDRVRLKDGLLAFTTLKPFTSFRVLPTEGGPTGGRFWLDNVRVAVGTPTPGPEAALPFALMALKRRKRRAT